MNIEQYSFISTIYQLSKRDIVGNIVELLGHNQRKLSSLGLYP